MRPLLLRFILWALLHQYVYAQSACTVDPNTSVPPLPNSCSGVVLTCDRSTAQKNAIANGQVCTARASESCNRCTTSVMQAVSPCADGYAQCSGGGTYAAWQPVAGGTACINGNIIASSNAQCTVCIPQSPTQSATVTPTRTGTPTASGASTPTQTRSPSMTPSSTVSNTPTVTRTSSLARAHHHHRLPLR